MSRLMSSYREAEGGWFSRERVLALVLMVATGLALYLCYRLAQPFLPALAWALAFAVVARPIHDWIAARIRQPDLAAGLAVVVVAVMLIAPMVFVIQQLGGEAAGAVQQVQAQAEAGRWRVAIERNPWLAPVLSWIEAHLDVPGEVHRAVLALTGDISSLLTGSVWALLHLLITLFALYYLFRDRRMVLQAFRSLMPLSRTEVDEMFTRVADTIHATIYGLLLMALLQGALGGLMFWWLGLPAPVLWGMVMALLAMLPYFGAFVVWVPAAVFLALEGSWGKAVILTAWGTIVVGLIDNVLYPILVGDRLRLHTLLIFIAILGGLVLFGASGVILGPIILAITVALLQVWRQRTADGSAAETGVWTDPALTR